MEKEESIEKRMIEYIDGRLNPSEHAAMKQLINKHESYQKMEKEYRMLQNAIEEDQSGSPSMALNGALQQMLRQEIDSLPKERITTDKELRISVKTIYRMAAVIALMLVSYWFGNYTTKKTYLPSLVALQSQHQELKTLAALSLFESESASKRIQGVAISMELEQPDLEVIRALINEMLYDKLVNVRLASARALEQFADIDVVKDAFIEALKNEENDTMQIELIEILSHLKEKRAIPKMKEILEDENTPIFIKDQVETELQSLI